MQHDLELPSFPSLLSGAWRHQTRLRCRSCPGSWPLAAAEMASDRLLPVWLTAACMCAQCTAIRCAPGRSLRCPAFSFLHPVCLTPSTRESNSTKEMLCMIHCGAWAQAPNGNLVERVVGRRTHQHMWPHLQELTYLCHNMYMTFVEYLPETIMQLVIHVQDGTAAIKELTCSAAAAAAAAPCVLFRAVRLWERQMKRMSRSSPPSASKRRLHQRLSVRWKSDSAALRHLVGLANDLRWGGRFHAEEGIRQRPVTNHQRDRRDSQIPVQTQK